MNSFILLVDILGIETVCGFNKLSWEDQGLLMKLKVTQLAEEVYSGYLILIFFKMG